MLRGGRDTVPLGGAWVVLHHIGQTSGGPIDSTRTNSRGRYRIPLGAVDTAGVYVVSAWYDSLAYFSLPLNVVGRPAVHVEDIVTYPTSIDSPPIRLARRLLTFARPGGAGEGEREVLEIIELENTGATTRITRDTLRPTWAGRVPAGAREFRAGQGDMSPEAIQFRNDSVLVLSPIPPGPGKQASYGYVLPPGVRHVAVPIDQETVEVNLLVEDTSAVVTAPGLDTLGVQEIEQRLFAAYRAGPLPAGSEITVLLPRGAFRAERLLPYLVATLAAGMVVALVLVLKKRSSVVSRRNDVTDNR